jgi:hypothetical protein
MADQQGATQNKEGPFRRKAEPFLTTGGKA